MTQTALVRAYGVCAILSAISFAIGLIVVFAFVDLPETEFDETVILALAGERTAFLAAQWFVVLGSAFAVAAAVGIQLFLGHAGGHDEDRAGSFRDGLALRVRPQPDRAGAGL